MVLSSFALRCPVTLRVREAVTKSMRQRLRVVSGDVLCTFLALDGRTGSGAEQLCSALPGYSSSARGSPVEHVAAPVYRLWECALQPFWRSMWRSGNGPKRI